MEVKNNVYEYAKHIRDRIPMLNPKPDPNTVLEEAKKRAEEIAEIIA